MVDVPAGERAVLAGVALGHEGDAEVRAEVLTIDVADDVGLEQGLVEQAVELLRLAESTARHRYFSKKLVPGGLGGSSHAAEVPARRLGAAVKPRVGHAHVRD